MADIRENLRDFVNSSDEFEERVNNILNGENGITEYRRLYEESLNEIITKYFDVDEEHEVLTGDIKEKINYISKTTGQKLGSEEKINMLNEIKSIGGAKVNIENGIVEDIENIVLVQEKIIAENDSLLKKYNIQLKKDEQLVQELNNQNVVNNQIIDENEAIISNLETEIVSKESEIASKEAEISGYNPETQSDLIEQAKNELKAIKESRDALITQKNEKSNLVAETRIKVAENETKISTLDIENRKNEYQEKLNLHKDMCKKVEDKKIEIKQKFSELKVRQPNFNRNTREVSQGTRGNVQNPVNNGNVQYVENADLPSEETLTSKEYAKNLAKNLQNMSVQELNKFMKGKGFDATVKALPELGYFDRRFVLKVLKNNEHLRYDDYDFELLPEEEKEILENLEGNSNIFSWSNDKLDSLLKYVDHFEEHRKTLSPEMQDYIEANLMRRISNTCLIKEYSKGPLAKYREKIFRTSKEQKHKTLLASMSEWNDSVNIRKEKAQNLKLELGDLLDEPVEVYRVNKFKGRENVTKNQNLEQMMKDSEER